jgi:Ca-activated chloride channel family protein
MRFRDVLFAASIGCAPAQACELALVLAVDVSGSVDPQEYKIQMQGLGAALADGAVTEALVVAQAKVMLIQWTGSSRQKVSVPWTQVTDFKAADALAARVGGSVREWRSFSTAIGEAVGFGLEQFDDVPECKRRVIDVSGDGVSNEGLPPAEMKAAALRNGVTINGLAIEASETELVDYYRANLIVGPASFAMQAVSFEDYPKRIRQKLLREITKQVASLK